MVRHSLVPGSRPIPWASPITQDEINAAINAGKLQYRSAETHGNPRPRLLRREVEELVRTQHSEPGSARPGLLDKLGWHAATARG